MLFMCGCLRLKTKPAFLIVFCAVGLLAVTAWPPLKEQPTSNAIPKSNFGLVFDSTLDGQWHFDIYQMRIDGSERQNLTNSPFVNDFLAHG